LDYQARAQRAHALFDLYDVDRDRQITRSDLRAYSDRMISGLSTGEDLAHDHSHALRTAFSHLWIQLAAVSDTDHNGSIGQQEFIAATDRGAFDGDPRFRRAVLEALDAIAEALDVQGDGYIARADYARLFDASGLDPHEHGLSFDELDTEGSGFLHHEQLRALALHLFPLADPSWLDAGSAVVVERPGIALVAHDSRKPDLITWAADRRTDLAPYRIFATGTTGSLLADKLGLEVTALHSGPLGGDQQIGSRITEGEIHAVIFFWDPLAAHPHGDDVRALVRLSTLANIPIALNAASADLLVTGQTLATS